MELSPENARIIENIIVDEANQRTYVILAPRVLSDGELYKVIRQEILRRGGRPLAHGETLTLTLTSTGGTATSVVSSECQKASRTVPNVQEREDANAPPV